MTGRKNLGLVFYIVSIFVIFAFGIKLLHMSSLEDISLYIGFPISIIILLILGIIFIIPITKNRRKTVVVKISISLLFITYLEFLIAALFVNGRYLEDNYRVPFLLYAEITTNLIPFNFLFSDYKAQLIFQFIENIVLLLPLGLICPYLINLQNHRWIKLCCLFLFPFLIEIFQLILRIGICDINDFIAYIIGTNLGSIVYKTNFMQNFILKIYEFLHIGNNSE